MTLPPALVVLGVGMCGLQGRFFGAPYEDGICLDGFIWGLDSCDEPGGDLHSGGEIPCPRCNRAAYVEHVKAVVEGEGYEAYSDGLRRSACPYPSAAAWPGTGEALRDAWLAGWDASRADSDEWITGKGVCDGL